MKDKILVTDEFIDFFQKNAETVGKKNAFWSFYKKEEGNIVSINYFLSLIDSLVRCLPLISIEGVFIPYYSEIFEDDKEVNRFVNKGEANDYINWENLMLNTYNNKLFPDYNLKDIGEYFECTINYVCQTPSKNTSLYKGYGFGQSIPIQFYYVPLENVTKIGIELSMRGEPFYCLPWGNEYPEFNLPLEMVSNNRELLKESFLKMKDHGFTIKNTGFEWGSHPHWAIDENGFLDKKTD